MAHAVEELLDPVTALLLGHGFQFALVEPHALTLIAFVDLDLVDQPRGQPHPALGAAVQGQLTHRGLVLGLALPLQLADQLTVALCKVVAFLGPLLLLQLGSQTVFVFHEVSSLRL